MEDNAVMTLGEAARFIRISERTLGELARQDKVPCQKVGREWRFLREALEAWLRGDGRDVTPKLQKAGGPVALYQSTFTGFKDTAFEDNRQRAMHRWVPWIAGFSASFVQDVLRNGASAESGKMTVLDPFAGVGTTLVEAMKEGCDSVGFEINPYAALASTVKTRAPFCDVARLRERCHALEAFINKSVSSPGHEPKATPPAKFRSRVRFFSPSVERQILFALDFIGNEKDRWLRDILRVALGSVIVSVSNYSYEPSLGTRAAAGKPNIEHADLHAVLHGKLQQIIDDILYFKGVLAPYDPKPHVQVYSESFFTAATKVPKRSIDVLITSPPYLNNYHYIRNTRPQMFWLGMVEDAGELKSMAEDSFGRFWQTVRSRPNVPLQVHIPELETLLEQLRSRHREKGPYGGPGWANYAASYFNDCARFCRIAGELLKPGGRAVVVIGNNILQGIEFPTDRLFAQIARQFGFEIVELHEVRTKRTGSSIVNSSVRRGTVRKRVKLYETAVEMRAPG